VYSTCLFCNGPLGRNSAVQCFPVGRRLAFDARRGRLWVICPRCDRWNLTPLEERWEAIETCTALSRAARRRVGTGEVELAFVDDGLQLVRVGAPSRDEFAAWRYGDQFGRRRRRWVVRVAAAAAGGAALAGAGAIAGAGVLIAYASVVYLVRQHTLGFPGDVVARVPGVPDQLGVLRWRDVERARIWGDGGDLYVHLRWGDDDFTLSGDAAARVAASVLQRMNRSGAPSDEVRAAVRALERTPDASRFAERFLVQGRAPRGLTPLGPALPGLAAFGGAPAGGEDPDPGITPGVVAPPYRTDDPAARVAMLADVDRVHRLALEMCLHEEQERRALEGEVAALERAWQEAERIAAIADDLLLPRSIGERLVRLRAR